LTVVVALVGRDAIVLASDSQETVGATKTTTQKLHAVGDRMVWGGAGDSALIQQVEATTGSIVPKLVENRWAVALEIRNVAHRVQSTASVGNIQFANAPAPQFTGLFCWYDPDGLPCIWQVATNSASSQFREWKAGVGSGQAFAEVALASVAHLNLPDLDIERLQMVAWKSIFDVIETSSFGVGPPIRLAVIQPGTARILSADEVDGVRDSVLIWLEKQREVLGSLAEVAEVGEFEVAATVDGDESAAVGEAEEVGIEPPVAD
jgi:20S proteasome alpha/beta subunit